MGSSGSIGTQTLDVVRAEPDRFRVSALGVKSSIEVVCEQAAEFRPDVVAVANSNKVAGLRDRLPKGCELLVGPNSLAEATEVADIIVNGVVGFAGLPVTLAALRANKRLGLANKESLIAAAPLVQEAWNAGDGELIPIDSEHCALHQCLGAANSNKNAVSELLLTASGGPFRTFSKEQLEKVKVVDALRHPTWSMGPKITVDSSTLMNKGLEVIEAHELFGISFDAIKVVVHPQSIVHSMATFVDGSTIAQLAQPDMRACIGYALAFPERLGVPFGRINWANSLQLDFHLPDFELFPCLGLAYEAGKAGQTAPTWLNAANEVAVAAFLEEKIRWVDIAKTIEKTMQEWPGTPATTLEAVLATDKEAREVSNAIVRRIAL